MSHKWVAVFDCDGVFTDGSFYYTKEGKVMKKFGADDFDAINELKKYCDIQVITGDKKGFEITKKRMDDVGIPCELVPVLPQQRWNWIKSRFPEQDIAFIGDGVYDWWAISQANYGMTTIDALDHVKEFAKYVSPRKGGDRFVADVCIRLMKMVLHIPNYNRPGWVV